MTVTGFLQPSWDSLKYGNFSTFSRCLCLAVAGVGIRFAIPDTDSDHAADIRQPQSDDKRDNADD